MLLPRYYVLNEAGVPTPAELFQWAGFFEKHGRSVAKTDVGEGRYVSTVFFGIDQNFSDQPHEPCVWESMLFAYGEPNDKHVFPGSLEQAEAHHRQLVELYCSKFNIPQPEIHFAFSGDNPPPHRGITP